MSPKVSQEHKEQRRNQLLQAAEEVFIEHGYENTTMKHVMNKAGVSRGGLYQYFDNKEDLFEALIGEQQQEIIDESLKAMIEKQGSHWDALLLTFLGESKKPTDHMDPLAPSKLEYFITGRNDTRRREHAKERYDHAYGVTEKIIIAGIEAGEFAPRFDPDVIARYIISYVDGLAVDHAIVGSESIKLKEQTELLIEYLRWGLNVKE
ncbi:TetR/AcrR family transcriptional regulator [Rossellomorea oryzaecorticis]|uniref:TetR/AcrR family transcriptional regulator n=1 Tax=Rossellomorea oryzaecorticis TaxID=1396505 RepID=A0ABU9K705_9BACI